MNMLPEPLQPLGLYRQFIVYRLEPRANGKTDKLPVNPSTMQVENAHNPNIWTDYDTARATAEAFGEGWGIGFVFTENDPFFFTDIDGALQSDGQWSPVANDLCSRLAGCAVEVSQSGQGLHVIGCYDGPRPEHSCKNTPLGLELYTAERFVALTGNCFQGGSAATSINGHLTEVIGMYFPPAGDQGEASDWVDAAVPEWAGPADDQELVNRATRSGGAGAVFGGKATFSDLWTGNIQKLAQAYPAINPEHPYDRSSADAALAQHLAFWTGKNPVRMERMMRASALVRDKWDWHKKYLKTTIDNATRKQKDVYDSGFAVSEYSDTADSLINEIKALDDRDVSGLKAVLIKAVRLEYLSLNQVERFVKKEKNRFGIDVPAIRKMLQKIKQERLPTACKLTMPVKIPCTVADVMNRYVWLRTEDKFFDRLTRDFVTASSLSMSYGHLVEDGSLESLLRNAKGLNEADGFTFIPGDVSELINDGPRVLINGWTPQGLTGRPGDITPWSDHMRLLFPRDEERKHIESWMAYTLQHQDNKINHQLVIGGKPRTGKDTVFEPMRQGIGLRYCNDINGSKLRKEYEDWAVAQKLVCIQEARFLGEEVEDRLKTFAASPPNILNLRRLGKPDAQQPNLLGIVLFTNRRNGVSIGSDQNRYYCAWSDAEPQSHEYYERLWEWFEHDNGAGYAYVIHHLMSLDISEFKPKAPAPRTRWRDELMEVSKSDEREMLERLIEDAEGAFECDLVTMDEIVSGMSARLGKRISSRTLGPILREIGCENMEAQENDSVTHKRKKYRLWVIRNVEFWKHQSNQDCINKFNIHRMHPVISPMNPGCSTT